MSTELELLSKGMALAQEKAKPSDSRFWSANKDSKQNYIALAKGELSLDYKEKNKTTVDGLNNLPNLDFPDEGEEAPPGIVSSDVFTTREDFKRREEEARTGISGRIAREEAAKREVIEAQYAPRIREREEYREDITKSVEGQFATKRRLSTAALSYVKQNREDAQRKVDEVIEMKDAALAKLDTETEAALDKELTAWRTEERYWIDLEQDMKKEEFSQFMQKEQLDLSREAGARAEQASILDTISTEYKIIKDIPEGETVEISGFTFTGIKEEEFEGFSASDLASMMKEIPEGQSKEVTDPVSGEVYLLQGLNEDVYTITDDQGNVTGLNKSSGKTEWKAEGVGKTKTQAASTTVIMNQAQSTALQDARKILENSKDEAGNYTKESYRTERLRFVELTGKPDLFDDQFKTGLDRTDPENTIYFDQSELDLPDDVVKYTEEQKNAFRSLDFTEEEIQTFEALGVDLATFFN